MTRGLPAIVVGAVFSLFLGTAAAQPSPQEWQRQLQRLREQGQAPNIQWENTEVSGAIKGMQGALLQVAAGGGENWIVQMDARPQDINFQGTADPAFVKTGMTVEFKAKVNKRGQAAEPVTNLTIFTVREGRGVGVQADGAAGKGEGGLFAPTPEEEKKGPKVKGDDPVYHVAGHITKLSRLGEMTINCAGDTVKATLDKEAKVAVDVNHLQWAQVGDKIDLRARYPMSQKANGQGLATQVTVVSAKVLGEPKKRVLPGTKPDEDVKKEADEK